MNNTAAVLTEPEDIIYTDDQIIGELREQILATRYVEKAEKPNPAYYMHLLEEIQREREIEAIYKRNNERPAVVEYVSETKLPVTRKDKWLNGEARHSWQKPIISVVRWIIKHDPKLIILQFIVGVVAVYYFVVGLAMLGR